MNSKIIIGIIIIIISIGVAISLSLNLSIPTDISNPTNVDSGGIITRNLSDSVVSHDSP